jgi:spoIIIJ-associated protein
VEVFFVEPVEIEGKNTEEAIEKAKQHFGVPLEKLDIEILSTASTGIFGLVGSRKARIRVTLSSDGSPRTAPAAPAKAAPPKAPPAKPAPAEVAPVKAVEAAPAPEKREPRPVPARPVPARPAPARPAPARPPAPEVDRPQAEPAAPEAREAPPAPVDRPAAPRDDGPGVEIVPPSQELVDRSLGLMQGLIERMGIETHLQAGIEEDRIVINIEGEKAGLLIGRRGQTLDALQYILNKMVNKAEKKPVRLVLDAEDYRGRRRQALEDLAARMGEKARRSGKPITISPMNAHDRRIVHLALKDDGRVRTASRGEGELKKIIIFPADKRH